jgi:hypothetical protein
MVEVQKRSRAVRAQGAGRESIFMQSNMTKDLSVTLPDKPGTLFKATDAIAKRGVNIEGYCVVPSGKEGIFHLFTSDPAGAKKALEEAGFSIREELDAFAIKVPDRPGALSSVLRPIADQELNVGVTYSLADGRVAFAARDISQIRTAVEEAQATLSRS